MSEVVAYGGRLIPVDFEGRNLDEWIQSKLETAVLSDGYDSWLEALEEERYGEYIFDRATGELYEIEREEFDPDGFLYSRKNDDGSYSFVLSYYNGGASFDEAAQGIFQQ